MSLILVKDIGNNKVRELECDAAGLLKTTVSDISNLALDATVVALSAKVVACDTGSIGGTVSVSSIAGSVACTHASLPLPTGAATETSLATVAGCVTSGVLAVSSSVAAPTSTSVYVFGSQGNPQAELSNLDAISTVVNVGGFQRIMIAGKTTKLDAEINLEVSADNLDWFDLNSLHIGVDYSSGHFGVVIDAPMKYIRVKRLGDSAAAGSDSLSCIVSGK